MRKCNKAGCNNGWRRGCRSGVPHTCHAVPTKRMPTIRHSTATSQGARLQAGQCKPASLATQPHILCGHAPQGVICGHSGFSSSVMGQRTGAALSISTCGGWQVQTGSWSGPRQRVAA